MIIVELIGGLGNQMFQYAFARSISLKNNLEFKIDISGFRNYKLRRYGLNYLNVCENIASQDEIKRIQKRGKIFRKIIGFIERRIEHNWFLNFFNNRLFPGYLFINEKTFTFDNDIYNLKIKRDIYLNGYWGSKEYFKDIEDIIRKEFRVKNAPDEKNQAMIDKISNCESVSLHIRRGDYANDPSLNKLFGTCSMDYYDNAINQVIKNIDNPNFFIFSDDPEWTKKNIKLSFPITFVTINGKDKDYEDLRLMSLCKHNIIANSTFSWWGAWLNNNPDKIVIAPKIWFADPVANAKINFEDLYPKEWIMI